MKQVFLKTFLFVIFGIGIIVLFNNCDELDGPTYFETPENPEDPDTNQNSSLYDNVYKILLEDFTGHTCTNCPRAHRTIESLCNSSYGKNIIPVSIHVGLFAQPATFGDRYTYDFRTPTGNEIDDEFAISVMGLPLGMINRIKYNNKLVLGESEWASAVSELLEKPIDLLLSVENEYNSATRNLSVKINSSVLNELENDLYLVIYITEDSIVNWQNDDGQHIEDYVHRHVLRDAIPNTFGEQVKSGPVAAGETIEKTYNYTISEEWDENHCEIIAYIYDGETEEVIQVENKAIIQVSNILPELILRI